MAKSRKPITTPEEFWEQVLAEPPIETPSTLVSELFKDYDKNLPPDYSPAQRSFLAEEFFIGALCGFAWGAALGWIVWS